MRRSVLKEIAITGRRYRSLALITLAGTLLSVGCNSASSGAKNVATGAHPVSAFTARAPTAADNDLTDAMDKLQQSLDKPDSSFHVSFKKDESDGFSYQCEADVSSEGITGKQSEASPTTHIGSDVFPASIRVRDLKGTPRGSPAWSTVRGEIEMAYLNGHLGDAQAGSKFAGDDVAGGFPARRYDFDLANVTSDAKTAMLMGNPLMPGGRQLKDYNIKGSAWIAKEDGRLVKFQFDSIMLFSDGENNITHYEGIVTKK